MFSPLERRKDGKLNDALAHLKDATIHAAQYKDKVAQTCFVGGGCMAVKPVRAVGETSTILPNHRGKHPEARS